MSELLETKTVEQIKQELGPIKASQVLRNTKLKQVRRMYSNGKDFCAIGVLLHEFGYHPRNGTYEYCRDKVEKNFGLDANTRTRVMDMNDLENKSFSEIADYLESKGL